MMTSWGPGGDGGWGRFGGAVKDGDDEEEEPGRKVFENEDGEWKANKEEQKVKGVELRSRLMAELTTCPVAVKILSLSVEGLSGCNWTLYRFFYLEDAFEKK